MARLLLFAFFLLNVLPMSLGPRSALADGKVFTPGPARVTIPDQDALIVWRDGVQTLAIETRFVAPGRDFAWVVPLPAKPEITPGTTGIFPTLRAVCAPRVDTRVAPYWIMFVWITIFLLAAMTVRTSWGRMGMLLVGLLVPMTCVLLPTLGSARGGSSLGPAVDVLERGVIGSYDVATVASQDPHALATWLSENGFTMSPAAQPVVADYIARGWVFSAAKLKRSNDTQERSAPHPLVFKFKTNQPVYPLRLTGVENGDLKVDLYIFGPSRAAVNGFEVNRCASAEVVPADAYRWGRVRDDVIELSHSGLAKLVGDGLVATKLTATLTPAQMTQDAQIQFVNGGPHLPSMLTVGAAWVRAINIGTGVLVAGVLIFALTSQFPVGRDRARKWAVTLGVLAFAAVGIAMAATPTIGTSGSFRDARSRWYAYHETSLELLGEANAYRSSGGRRTDEAWVRQRIKELLAPRLQNGEGPFEEGDGPGCYSFTLTPNGGVTFTWHTDFGNECTETDSLP